MTDTEYRYIRQALDDMERLHRAGFWTEGTGGGCTALIKRFNVDGKDVEILITDGDLSAPVSFDGNDNYTDRFVVGTYTDGEYWDNSIEILTGSRDVVGDILHAAACMLIRETGRYADYTLCELWPDHADHVPEAYS